MQETKSQTGGEYSIATDDGRVRPKHVLIEYKKWMCYIDGQKNKYSVSNSYKTTGKIHISASAKYVPVWSSLMRIVGY
jgi:hypothetical protein